MKSYFLTIILFLSISVGYAQPQPRKVNKVPKNVIIMISDGCGYNHIQATDLYQYGEFESQNYEKFPVKLFMSTYPAYTEVGSLLMPARPYSTFDAWNDFRYVNNDATCSAASGTAIATGVKTYNGAIGMDINRQPLKNLSELAIEKNKSAGVVTSVQWSHATPACFVAHNVSRDNYSEIAKDMLINSKLSVIMGCGNPDYDNSGNEINKKSKKYKYVGDSLIWRDLNQNSSTLAGNSVQDIDQDGQADEWELIQNKDDFEAIAQGKFLPKRIIGTAKVAQTLQQAKNLTDEDYYKGSKTNNEDPDELIKNSIKTVPSLETMAAGALNVLNQNPNGFFLMIEGGAVDWAAHSNQTARMITEEIYFNNAVNRVIKWVEDSSSWEETLLIITADHETGYITAPYKGEPNKKWEQLPKSAKGTIPNIQWNSDNHTNSLVPLFAKGICCEYLKLFADETDIRRGKYLNNTEPAQLIFLLWR